MSPTILLGAASALIKNRKIQLLLVGVQFAYVTYSILRKKKAKK